MINLPLKAADNCDGNEWAAITLGPKNEAPNDKLPVSSGLLLPSVSGEPERSNGPVPLTSGGIPIVRVPFELLPMV